MQVLVVKTSSLGDLIQTFAVVEDLRHRFPDIAIDWVVEESLQAVLKAHPFLRKVIAVPMRELKQNPFSKALWKRVWHAAQDMRSVRYDCVFDLQGNSKSGLWTFLSKSFVKIGFSWKGCREKLNVFATNTRFDVDPKLPMQLQYRSLVEKYFGKDKKYPKKELLLTINQEEEAILRKIVLQKRQSLCVCVCPGSRWKNKQLSVSSWISFLQKCSHEYSMHFLFVWGSLEEKRLCEQMQRANLNSSVLPDKLSVAALQHLMHSTDLVMAVDSSALHLCGTTKTPSFSIFGPTLASLFQPLGDGHGAFQSICPYGQTFVKQCPFLRSCKTGACMSDISVDSLFQNFRSWFSCVINK